MSTAAHRLPADGSADDPAVTTGPIAGSAKGYLDLAEVRGARVPYRRVPLADGRHVDLYDSSGPNTDPDAVLDVDRGLPPRPGVIGGVGTQLQRARDGVVTAEMAFVAAREGLRPKLVRDEIAAGRAVIPANHRHPESEPMIIGKAFRVKVTANVGTSNLASGDSTLEDMVWSIRWGPTRSWTSPPVGTGTGFCATRPSPSARCRCTRPWRRCTATQAR